MPYKKFSILITLILMALFSQFSLAHDTGILHQHGAEIALLGVLAVAFIAAKWRSQ